MDWAEGLSREEYFAKEREDLKGQQGNFERCLAWLDEHPHIEGKRSAHALKDEIQFNYRLDVYGHHHIPRGVFILAALYRGYKVTKMEGSSNAWIEEREEVPA